MQSFRATLSYNVSRRLFGIKTFIFGQIDSLDIVLQSTRICLGAFFSSVFERNAVPPLWWSPVLRCLANTTLYGWFDSVNAISFLFQAQRCLFGFPNGIVIISLISMDNRLLFSSCMFQLTPALLLEVPKHCPPSRSPCGNKNKKAHAQLTRLGNIYTKPGHSCICAEGCSHDRYKSL